jgi:hypothetical protein
VGLTYSDNALMTRVFAPPRSSMPLAPRAGRSSLGTGDACRRGIAFGYEPVRLKFRRAEKVARCNRRSNLPGDLTLIHGRGMMRHKSSQRQAGKHEAP